MTEQVEAAKKFWEEPHTFSPTMFQGREQLGCAVCGYMEEASIHKLPAPVAEPKKYPPDGYDFICDGSRLGLFPKPQPDSSSIDLKLWLDQAVDLLNLYHSGYCPKDVAKDFLDKCKENFGNVTEYKPFVDSSSISSEQTFGDWWNKQGRLFMAGDDIHVQRAVMGVCERAWAAAKGSTDTEGR